MHLAELEHLPSSLHTQLSHLQTGDDSPCLIGFLEERKERKKDMESLVHIQSSPINTDVTKLEYVDPLA